MKKVSLHQIFEEYNGDPHQIAAINELAASLPDELLSIDSDWVITFRVAPARKEGTFSIIEK